MNIVKIDPKQFGIEEKQAKEIQSGLAVAIEERKSLIGEFEKVSKLEITEENLPAFKELRLRIVKNRTQGIEKWHKTSKEYFLRGGQFVDAIKRKEIQINESMEEKLLEGEKHFERLEKERMQKLKETRVKLLLPYYEDAEMLGLEAMNEDVFNSFLVAKKREYEERIEAEKKAEEERIAKEKAEAERVRLQEIENAKLKAEAEKREKEIEAERKRVEAEREKERKEADAKQKAIQEQARKEREKAEAIAKAEAEKRAKLEAELQAKKEAEQKAENERKASEEKAKKEAEKLAKAPIKKQLSVWVNSFELPKSEINNELSKEIESKFDSFKKWSLSQIENL
jgi:hypothetical protein